MADETLPTSDGKSIFLSKTLWWNILLAATAFIPVVNQWIVAHADYYAVLVAAVNVVLRLVSKDALYLY